MLQRVEIEQLRGVNRNAVEGVAQVVPTELRGFNLNKAGGYYAGFAQSGTPITSGVSGSVSSHDAYGVVLLDDETFIFDDALIDFSSASPAGKRVYLVPRVGVVSHARTVAEDEYDIGAFVEDVADNFGDVFRQDAASFLITNVSSTFTASSLSVQFFADATAGSGNLDSGTYKAMALWLKPTAQGLVVYDTTHATVSLSGTERIEIQSAGFLPAGYGVKTYLAKDGDGRFSQYFPNFASGGAPENQPTVFSDGEGTFVAEIGTFASGSFSVEVTNNAIINFCSKLACVEPHNRRVWSRAAATPFVGPFIEGYSPLKRVEFSYTVDAFNSGNNYFFSASGPGLISVNDTSNPDWNFRVRFDDGVTYEHEIGFVDYGKIIESRKVNYLSFLKENSTNFSTANLGFGLQNIVEISGSIPNNQVIPEDLQIDPFVSVADTGVLVHDRFAFSYPWAFVGEGSSTTTEIKAFKLDGNNNLNLMQTIQIYEDFSYVEFRQFAAHNNYLVAVGTPPGNSIPAEIYLFKLIGNSWQLIFREEVEDIFVGRDLAISENIIVAHRYQGGPVTPIGPSARVFDIEAIENGAVNVSTIVEFGSLLDDYGNLPVSNDDYFYGVIRAHKKEFIVFRELTDGASYNSPRFRRYEVQTTGNSAPTVNFAETIFYPSPFYSGGSVDYRQTPEVQGFDFNDTTFAAPYKTSSRNYLFHCYRSGPGENFNSEPKYSFDIGDSDTPVSTAVSVSLDEDVLVYGSGLKFDVFVTNKGQVFSSNGLRLVQQFSTQGNDGSDSTILPEINKKFILAVGGEGNRVRGWDLSQLNINVTEEHDFVNFGTTASGSTGPFGGGIFPATFETISSSYTLNYRDAVESIRFTTQVLAKKYIEYFIGPPFAGINSLNTMVTNIINEDGVTVESSHSTVTAWNDGDFYASGTTLEAMQYDFESGTGTIQTDVTVEFYNAELSTDAGLQVALNANNVDVFNSFTDSSTSTVWTPNLSGLNKGALVVNDLAAANIARLNTPSTIVYSDIGYVNFASTVDQFLQLELIASDEITALVSTPAGLVVFADNEAFLVRGDPANISTFQAQRFSATVGCDDGVRPGRLGGTVFTIWKGRLYSMTLGMGDVDFGSGVEDIGRPVYDPEDPFVQVVGEPRTRQIVVRTQNGRVYRFSTDAGEWFNDVFDNEGAEFLLPNADDDGTRYLVGTDLRTVREAGDSPYVQWEDLDLGDKGLRKMFRRVYAYFGDDYAGTPTLEYEVGSNSGTVTGSEEGAGWFSFTLPNGLVNEKMQRLRLTMANASFGDEFEPPVIIEFVPRNTRR